jgi:EAL domain-containing protein (putative c-di-GMP-specific phosphodiesterase class I)
LDDFGVGFTSFAYLKQLPVDYIKIDGAFIRNLSRHSDDRFLVKAMAEVARGLGKKTVAEFVEQEACLELLKGYGVDFAQGYFIGRPQPWTDKFLA